MRPIPDRGFFKRAHLPRRYRDALDEGAMFGPPPVLPTDPDELAETLLEVLRPQTRSAIAALAALTDRPDPALVRHVSHRCRADPEAVAAAFGLVKQRGRWCRADEQPLHLPLGGDNELLMAFTLYRATGGRAEVVGVG